MVPIYISANPTVLPSSFFAYLYIRLFNSSAAFSVNVKATILAGVISFFCFKILTILLVTTPVLPAPAHAIISKSSSIVSTASFCLSESPSKIPIPILLYNSVQNYSLPDNNLSTLYHSCRLMICTCSLLATTYFSFSGIYSIISP